MRSCAQSSIEYLLLLAAFFGVLGVMLPVMSSTTQSFIEASDNLLAKKLSQDLAEQISLMSFLGNGSVKQIDCFSSKGIFISSQGNNVIFSVGEKEYLVNTGSVQVIPKQEFNGKFSLKIQKIKNSVQVLVFKDLS
jgi:hypothetical protein